MRSNLELSVLVDSIAIRKIKKTCGLCVKSMNFDLDSLIERKLVNEV